MSKKLSIAVIGDPVWDVTIRCKVFGVSDDAPCLKALDSYSETTCGGVNNVRRVIKDKNTYTYIPSYGGKDIVGWVQNPTRQLAIGDQREIRKRYIDSKTNVHLLRLDQSPQKVSLSKHHIQYIPNDDYIYVISQYSDSDWIAQVLNRIFTTDVGHPRLFLIDAQYPNQILNNLIKFSKDDKIVWIGNSKEINAVPNIWNVISMLNGYIVHKADVSGVSVIYPSSGQEDHFEAVRLLARATGAGDVLLGNAVNYLQEHLTSTNIRNSGYLGKMIVKAIQHGHLSVYERTYI